jgi:hypothetical protein
MGKNRQTADYGPYVVAGAGDRIPAPRTDEKKDVRKVRSKPECV